MTLRDAICANDLNTRRSPFWPRLAAAAARHARRRAAHSFHSQQLCHDARRNPHPQRRPAGPVGSETAPAPRPIRASRVVPDPGRSRTRQRIVVLADGRAALHRRRGNIPQRTCWRPTAIRGPQRHLHLRRRSGESRPRRLRTAVRAHDRRSQTDHRPHPPHLDRPVRRAWHDGDAGNQGRPTGSQDREAQAFSASARRASSSLRSSVSAATTVCASSSTPRSASSAPSRPSRIRCPRSPATR